MQDIYQFQLFFFLASRILCKWSVPLWNSVFLPVSSRIQKPLYDLGFLKYFSYPMEVNVSGLKPLVGLSKTLYFKVMWMNFSLAVWSAGVEDKISPEFTAAMLSCKVKMPLEPRPPAYLNVTFPFDKQDLLRSHNVSHCLRWHIPIRVSQGLQGSGVRFQQALSSKIQAAFYKGST